jgi:hypothetical protein
MIIASDRLVCRIRVSASRRKIVVYAFDIPAWAGCQACNTSADNRPRSLML